MIQTITALIAAALLPISASEPAKIQQSLCPSGVFGIRQAAQGTIDDPTLIEIYNVETKKTITAFPFGGYASYAMAADPMNLKWLWAPDSKHIALMERTTKRTWQTFIYSVADSGCKKLDAPDFTEFALASLHQKSIFRFLRETPVRWSANNRLEIDVAGDYGTAPEIFSYDGTIVFDMTSEKVSLPSPLTTKSKEG